MDYKQVVVVRQDLDIGVGKLSTQVAQATVKAYQRTPPQTRKAWEDEGRTIITLKGTGEDQLQILMAEARKNGLPYELLTDMGHTEIEPGTETVLAIGPANVGEVDAITGHLTPL